MNELTLVIPGTIRSKKNSKRDDADIVSAYQQTGSVWKAASILGMCGQSVHERLKKLGIQLKQKRITREEKEIVIEYYKNTPDGDFDRYKLLNKLPKGTTISRIEHIVTMARVGNKNRKHNDLLKKKQSENKMGIKPPHNGFAGFKHTPESKQKISQASKRNWKNPNYPQNTVTGKLKLAEVARQNGLKALNSINTYSRCKRGYYEIPGRGSVYFRSKWEANYALYLQFMVNNGQILSWEYESQTFEFPVKRGCRFYTPDFLVINPDKSKEYHEVKGWMDKKSKTKIKRMRIYHKEEKLVLIGESEYKNLKKYSQLLKWY